MVREASRVASRDEPRSLSFRPVHDGPAEIAAPLKNDSNPGEDEGVMDTDAPHKPTVEVGDLCPLVIARVGYTSIDGDCLLYDILFPHV